MNFSPNETKIIHAILAGVPVQQVGTWAKVKGGEQYLSILYRKTGCAASAHGLVTWLFTNGYVTENGTLKLPRPDYEQSYAWVIESWLETIKKNKLRISLGCFTDLIKEKAALWDKAGRPEITYASATRKEQ